MYQWEQCDYLLPFGCMYISHLLTSRLTCCSEGCTYMHCSCTVTGHAYVMHILCTRMLHDAHCHYHYLGMHMLMLKYIIIYIIYIYICKCKCQRCKCKCIHQCYKRSYIKAPPAGKCCRQHNNAKFLAAGNIRCSVQQ